MSNKHSKITLADYLADKCPNDCFDVLMSSGYEFETPRNKSELSALLKQYISKDKESALKKLAEIHPDKELCQSIDRPVVDKDFGGHGANAMFGQNYGNPFFPNFYANPHQISPNMMAFSGMPYQHMNACGCGGHASFNGFSCDGNKSCGCGGGSKMGADGSSKTNNLLYLLIGAGFVYLLMNLDGKHK